MIFTPDDDQQLVLEALGKLCAPYRSPTPEQVVRPFIYRADLRDALADGGFLDVGVADAAAAGTSALVVAELAKLPVAAELTGSALVRPAAFPDALGPVALINGDPRAPTRFLPVARTACILRDGGVTLCGIGDGDVEEVSSLFAYPLGRLSFKAAARAVPLGSEAATAALRWWRIGVALEIYGALDAAMALTLKHVRERRQFGRPIGAFQAVQHRLAMAATAVQGTRWLALSAVFDASPAAAAMALGYAQRTARDVAYDLHQFSGAMGLTLEYPLHLFTYRTKLLQAELGGGRRQFSAAADEVWPERRAA